MRTALDFARWLQGIDVQIIGEDVDIKDLYERWNGDRRCNHDPAALTSVEILQCECGAVVHELDPECRHCGEVIEQDPDSGEWLHVRSGETPCDSWESNAEPADA